MNSKKNKDLFEQLVKGKLADYNAEVPPLSWEKLESSLLAAQKIKIVRSKWIASSLTAVAAALIGVFFVFQNLNRELPIKVSELQTPKTESQLTTKIVTTEDIKETPLLEKKSAKTKRSNQLLIADNVSSIQHKTSGSHLSTIKEEEEEEEVSPSIYTDVKRDDAQIENKTLDDKKQTSTIDEETKQKLIKEFINEGNRSLPHSEETKTTKRKSRNSISLTGQSGLSSSQQTNTTPNTLRSSLNDSYGVFTMGKMEAFNEEEEIKPESEINHMQPISFGLLTSFNLSQKLQIETGLIYTYLSSETKSKSNDYSESETMQFHYLGIPVNLNYTLLSINKFDLFLSAGAMIEKDINGKIKYSDEKENTLLNSKFASKRASTIKQQNPQVSLSSGVGITYPLYDKVKLFGKVGGSYYINANNEYRTYYSDEKFGLDIQLGIKFNF